MTPGSSVGLGLEDQRVALWTPVATARAWQAYRPRRQPSMSPGRWRPRVRRREQHDTLAPAAAIPLGKDASDTDP